MTYAPTGFQLTHLLQRVYDKLEQVKGVLATSAGTTASIVASSLSALYTDFSEFDGAVAFVERDAGGAGAAPEGEYALVTNYTQSTGTLAFATSAFTAAPSTGDSILIAQGALYPLYDVIRKCNTALRNLSDVPLLDTTLTTATSQTEYDMPSGVLWNRIVKIEIQGYTGDTNDNQYFEVRPEDVVVPPTVGGTALLVLDQYPSGYTIRITHLNLHPTLTSYDSNISQAIHPTLAVAACALECASINRQASQQIGLLDKLIAERREAEILHPVQKLIPSVRGMKHWTPSSLIEKDRFTYPDPP